MQNKVLTRKGEPLGLPPILDKLFSHPLAGLIWLPFRLWLGWKWIDASLHKITNPAWMQGGEALKGFWSAAVQIPETGRPPISFDWYRSFIQFMLDAQAYTWFAKLVAIGEMLVGVALILGLFTALSAFIGGFMNWNFMMAGSASVNPMYFAIAVFLVIAWKVSGYFGLDYFLMPIVGSLWSGKKEKPGKRPARGALPARAELDK